MYRLLATLLYICVIVYIDDVIVYSPTFERHLIDLEQVFKIFHDHNVRLKWKKCSFAQKEVKYLGHTISAEGVRPDAKKINALLELHRPPNVSQVRSS